MRRSYISPEFDNVEVNGTLNTVDSSSFFGTNLLKIEDQIIIDDVDIIWYQLPTKEQTDLSVESTLTAKYYSSSNDKKANHIIYKDINQSLSQEKSNTRWIIDINFETILKNYIFSEIKRSRSLNGLKNNMTVFNDVDIFIMDYLSNNIINKYDINEVELFISYKNLILDSSLKSNNNWNQNISKSNKLANFESIQQDSNIKISFNQKDSEKFSFDYYFNIIFNKK
jgi:hypothetical protein